MALVACAFCGNPAEASTMDATGHGWRCPACTMKSQINEHLHGDGAAMTEHLTRSELVAIVDNSWREMAAGAGLAVVGALLTIAVAASGTSILIVFSGMIFGGLGMIGHAMHRRKSARTALASIAPADARVVKH